MTGGELFIGPIAWPPLTMAVPGTQLPAQRLWAGGHW